jgi:hypothetical protein
MDISITAATIRALMASGGTCTPEAISDHLTLCMELFNSGEKEGWTEVFLQLGEQHPGVLRLRIIEAVILASKGAQNSLDWICVWMGTIPAAGIHPISIPLCSAYIYGPTRDLMFQAYSIFCSANPGMPTIINDHDISRGIGLQEISIELPPDCATNDILGITRLRVHEQYAGSIHHAGRGWCVWDLEWVGMNRLTELGPDLSVFRHLNLITSPNVKRIGPRSVVGGITKVYANNISGRSLAHRVLPRGEWKRSVGLRTAHCDLAWPKGNYMEFERGHLPNPIETPCSLYRLLFGIL